MFSPSEVYDLMIQRVSEGAAISQAVIGLTWTLCEADGIGLAMSPAGGASLATRSLPWSGTLAGRPASELVGWLRQWEPYAACIGMAAANAVINARSPLPEQAISVPGDGPANLSVFEYFMPRLSGKKVVVVGRYPGLETYQHGMDLTVLERQPGNGDMPDPAAEFLLPEADWVFLTASSLSNKTFPRLAELSADAHLVLMGPTTPWLPELADFGVDFLAGVKVHDADVLRRTVAEGGGVRIFGEGVRYAVADLRATEMDGLKQEIDAVAGKRQQLKEAMERWYEGGNHKGFPQRRELEQIDQRLSALDTQYKHLWDARFGSSGFVRPAGLQPEEMI